MAEDARYESQAGGLASGVLWARKQSPPGVAQCGHCAREKRMQNILRPMGRARNPVAASKHRADNELRSPRKLLPKLREFHSTHRGARWLRVDTCFKGPLYYGNAICRRTSNFNFVSCWRFREEHPGGTQSCRESHTIASGTGPKLRVSKNQALLHE